jgi:L-ascorbate metabolism protein UlaG (beta-lactamase superfamily)
MQIEDLPEIDLIVLSHLHDDHFDRVAERKLDRSLRVTVRRRRAGFRLGAG